MTRTEAQAVAVNNALAYRKADIEHLFRGAAEPDKAVLGYHHGWFSVEDHSSCLEELFPGEHHPRFPADQGLSD